MRLIKRSARGVWCEGRMWTGPYYGARCIFPATGYQFLNDIYVCGVHARAYTRIESLAAGPAAQVSAGAW